MSGNTFDVIVGGGGIVGLSVAYCVAKEGLRVAVLDQGRIGGEASWATAGVIGAYPYQRAKTPFTALLGLGAQLHEQWVEELRAATGIDPGYRRCGGLELGVTPQEAHSLRSEAGHYRSMGVTWAELDRDQLRQLEPHVRDDFSAAYYVPDMAQARPPRFLQALGVACIQRGVAILPYTPVLELVRHGSRIEGVRTPGGVFSSSWTVLCAGAWCDHLLAPLGIQLQVRPIRGQIVLLQASPTLVHHILMMGHQYVVPRFDGRYLIGSTLEEAGFDRSTTAEGIHALLQFALWICPAFREARMEATWAGLRPGNPDGKPLIGPCPPYEGLLIATGHYRSGFVAGPATGLVISQLICQKEPAVPLGPFRVDRLLSRPAEEPQ